MAVRVRGVGALSCAGPAPPPRCAAMGTNDSRAAIAMPPKRIEPYFISISFVAQ